MSDTSALILVVDDNEMNRDMLSRRLERSGHRTQMAEDGVQALELMALQSFDLVMLDIMMPRMSGYEVLEHAKADPKLRHVPIIVVSALDELDSVVRCIELGAEDYLFKPFNPVLLRARVEATLEKKRLRESEQMFLSQQTAAPAVDIWLPDFVTERIKTGKERVVDHFDQAAVLVARIVGLSEVTSPEAMIALLEQHYSAFDTIVRANHLLRVRALGTEYVIAAGIPTWSDEQVTILTQTAQAMQAVAASVRHESGTTIGIQIGVHTGPVIGATMKSVNVTYYDLWGEALMVASQLAAFARIDGTLVSPTVAERLGSAFRLEPAGGVVPESAYVLIS